MLVDQQIGHRIGEGGLLLQLLRGDLQTHENRALFAAMVSVKLRCASEDAPCKPLMPADSNCAPLGPLSLRFNMFRSRFTLPASVQGGDPPHQRRDLLLDLLVEARKLTDHLIQAIKIDLDLLTTHSAPPLDRLAADYTVDLRPGQSNCTSRGRFAWQPAALLLRFAGMW